MNMHRDPRVKAAFDRIVARTPEIGPTPSPQRRTTADHSALRRYGLLAGAAAVAALGVAGIAWAATSHDGPSNPASAPTEPTPTTTAPVALTEPTESMAAVVTPELSGPNTSASTPPDTAEGPVTRGGPTLFPILDPGAVSDAPIIAGLSYSGGFVKPQTSAVVARIGTDGSTTDLYTFIVGAGVLTYTDGVGISIDATTPQVTDVAGFGYAAWTASGEPVLVMAADPTALLDDPAFSMSVSNDNNGDATLDLQSLPPGFELLVEPYRFSREAATANLSIASRLDRATSVGGVSASLDNPLTNLNLTEGTTITPSQVGDSDAWIVSSAESDYWTVVWSPDDTTWVMVNRTGSQQDLLKLADALSFTPNVGEWMTLYAVDLPPIEFDGATAAG